MNYLIVGLGNIGDEYARTRHNIGFRVLDALAGASNLVFEDKRYGFVTTLKVKNQTLTLLKPSTYMNLSGNAVRYWMKEKNVPIAIRAQPPIAATLSFPGNGSIAVLRCCWNAPSPRGSISTESLSTHATTSPRRNAMSSPKR